MVRAKERGHDMHGPVALLVSDHAVLASLEFSLTIEGFQVMATDDLAAAALVIDQNYRGDGLAALLALRAQGCHLPAVILSTNPTRRWLSRAAAAGAAIVEKPLFGDELSGALFAALRTKRAA